MGPSPIDGLGDALHVRFGVTELWHSSGARLYRETQNLQDGANHLRQSDVNTAAIYAKWSDETVKKTVSDW